MKGKYWRVQKKLNFLLLGAGLLIVIAFVCKGKFASYREVLPELLQPPEQSQTRRQPFTFAYKGEKYKVQPVADYELWGMVVSHNDINSLWDMYHDDSSVDTRDLCVIWGTNLKSDDFHRVEYESGAWTCYFRYPGGIRFSHAELSNNHLITDKQSIRDKIGTVRIGDQIHLAGLLVNYQSKNMGNFWRRSSTTRKDSGNQACEVMFVDDARILRQGTPGWYFIYRLGWWLLFLILALKALVLYAEIRKPA